MSDGISELSDKVRVYHDGISGLLNEVSERPHGMSDCHNGVKITSGELIV